jgi:tetratricopeptide (TPR) repeat protein
MAFRVIVEKNMRLVLVFAALCTGIVGVHADSGQTARLAQARAFFEKGNAAFRAGDFDAATLAFSQAYDISPRPLLLFNIGLAASKAKQPELALRSFEKFLDVVPNSPDRQDVEGKIAELRKVLERQRSAPAVAAKPAAVAAKPSDPPPAEAYPSVAVAIVAAPAPPARKPLIRRAWFWGAVAGAAVVVGGGIALGVTLGHSTVFPTPTGQAPVQ